MKRPLSIPCQKKMDASELACLFLTHFYQYYSAPNTVISDHRPQFVSTFWQAFCKIIGISLKLSTTQHPETDGQTKIVNQHITMHLHLCINYHQDDWSKWLPLLDHAVAVLVHESTRVSPFFASQGYESRTLFNWHNYYYYYYSLFEVYVV